MLKIKNFYEIYASFNKSLQQLLACSSLSYEIYLKEFFKKKFKKKIINIVKLLKLLSLSKNVSCNFYANTFKK